jgi:hypothetical protein
MSEMADIAQGVVPCLIDHVSEPREPGPEGVEMEPLFSQAFVVHAKQKWAIASHSLEKKI